VSGRGVGPRPARRARAAASSTPFVHRTYVERTNAGIGMHGSDGVSRPARSHSHSHPIWAGTTGIATPRTHLLVVHTIQGPDHHPTTAIAMENAAAAHGNSARAALPFARRYYRTIPASPISLSDSPVSSPLPGRWSSARGACMR
jgi:hypothetical protein